MHGRDVAAAGPSPFEARYRSHLRVTDVVCVLRHEESGALAQTKKPRTVGPGLSRFVCLLFFDQNRKFTPPRTRCVLNDTLSGLAPLPQARPQLNLPRST